MLEFSKVSYNIHLRGSPEAISLCRRIHSKMAVMYADHIPQEAIALSWLREIVDPPLAANYQVAAGSLFSNSVNSQVAGAAFQETSGSSGTLRGGEFYRPQ